MFKIKANFKSFSRKDLTHYWQVYKKVTTNTIFKLWETKRSSNKICFLKNCLTFFFFFFVKHCCISLCMYIYCIKTINFLTFQKKHNAHIVLKKVLNDTCKNWWNKIFWLFFADKNLNNASQYNMNRKFSHIGFQFKINFM